MMLSSHLLESATGSSTYKEEDIMKILEVRNLTKKFDDKSGIFNFNMDIETGDVVLLLGPNGAGKTTAFRCILGLVPVRYNSIKVLDVDISDKVEAFKKIGAMISKPVFYDYLTGYEHIKTFGSVYKDVDVNGVLEKVELLYAKDKLVGDYSSGMKQRLDLARAIMHNPNLLILDEPFNGMDIEAKYNLKKLLKEMQKRDNTGIVISSHMVGDLENFANKVVIVYEGNTLYKGLMCEINNSGLTLEEFYLERLNLYKSGGIR